MALRRVWMKESNSDTQRDNFCLLREKEKRTTRLIAINIININEPVKQHTPLYILLFSPLLFYIYPCPVQPPRATLP